MKNTVNAVKGLQSVFGKTTTQLNKGNLNIRKCMVDLEISDMENVTLEQFQETVEYFAEIKSGKYVLPVDYDIEKVDFTVLEKTAKAGEKKGTIAQLRAFIEEKGLTQELSEFVNM